jgi:peptide/nickel transport system substrate-binding protein
MAMSDANRTTGHDGTMGRITRRDLIRLGAALGLSGPALAGIQGIVSANEAAQQASPAATSGEQTGMLKAPEANPKHGGSLRTAFGVTTSNYDIYQGGNQYVLTHLYDGLVRFDPLDGLRSIIPSLATSWEVSDDSLTYTFHLRDGVKYHDGEPFTSADVAATFNRAINPPGTMVSVMKAFYRSVKSVEAVDPQTAVFHLSEPQSDLMSALAAPFSVIYSKKVLDANNQDLRGVIAPGTGPFVYDTYQEAERWILKRNPNYWNPELPYVDQLELLHVAAWSDRGTAVLTGQADFSWNVSRETFDEGQKRDDVAGKEIPSIGCYTVILNTQKEPLNNPDVRRAMYLALNRQALIQAYRTQETIALTRWVSHANELAMPSDEIAKLPGYRANKDEDIATAKKLLADAGFPDGIKGLELLSASVPPHAEIMSPAIQDMLKSALNIEVNIRVTERALLVEEESKGTFQMVLDTPTTPISDFSALGTLYFKTDGSQNFGKYSNADFDAMLTSVGQELDKEKQRTTLRKIEDLLDQDPPWLLIGWTFHLPLWQSSVKGLAMEKRTQSIWGRLDTAWIDK